MPCATLFLCLVLENAAIVLGVVVYRIIQQANTMEENDASVAQKDRWLVDARDLWYGRKQRNRK